MFFMENRHSISEELECRINGDFKDVIKGLMALHPKIVLFKIRSMKCKNKFFDDYKNSLRQDKTTLLLYFKQKEN